MMPEKSTCPHISPHLPTPPHTSPHLPPGAPQELHGKQFDGRTVLASFLPPEAFQAVKGLDCFTA